MARTTTATLPTGERVRTASQSLYVLFADYGLGKGAYIVSRSSNRATIERKASRTRVGARDLGLVRPRCFLVLTDGTGRVEEI